MSKKIKAPPKLNIGDSYKTWKSEVLMWQIVCGIDKKEQAIVIRLESFVKNPLAKRCVETLTIEELYAEGGVPLLLGKLDETFKKDKCDEDYANYLAFTEFKRGESQDMIGYISEFEHLYYQMYGDNSDVKMADNIRAFKLLDSAELSEQERKMVFAAMGSTVSYDKMKSAIKRIFTKHSDGDTNANTSIIKQEEAFVTYKKGYNNNKMKYSKPYQANSNKKLQLKSQKGKLWNNKQHRRGDFNPPQFDGKTSRCLDCDSKKHWVDECPHVPDTETANMINEFSELYDEKDEGVEESANLVLIAEKIEKHEILVTETSKSAIVDTACSKTVAGLLWFQQFYDHLSESNKKLVLRTPSQTSFRFGDGRKVIASEKVVFPVTIAGVNCKIEAELVPENIPLLLSKSSLKRAGTIIDLQRDRAVMFNKEVDLHLSTAGHYCIEISCESDSGNGNNDCFEEVLFLERTLTKNERKSQIIKIHKQFGHASESNMKKIIKNAGAMDSQLNKLIDEVLGECQVCAIYRKPPAKPVVGFSRSQDFNQCVAMDLHQLGPNLWYIHFIDEFTRYSNAIVIRKKSVSGLAFLRCWISLFGAPSSIFSDNGGEFIADDFYELCETFNIKVSTSASYSPWSNGIVERHNQTLTNIILKVKEDIKCPWETAVAWAVSPKNSLINHNGFSPSQLVFGRNGNFPSTINDSLPALDKDKDVSSAIGMHIAALHAARQEFISCESSEKIKRALRRQVRTSGHKYQIGQEVWYKRDDQKKWCGPAKVLGQDGPVLFLRHGTRPIKAHVCRVMPVHPKPYEQTGSNPNEIPQHSNSNETSLDKDYDSEDDCESFPEVSTESNTSMVNPATSSGFDVSKLKSNQRISFVPHNNNDTIRYAKILGNAGKKSGPHKNWYNIQYEGTDSQNGEKLSIDLSSVQQLTVLDQPTASVANEDAEILKVQDSFSIAKEAELQSWQQNSVYEEVLDNGQKCLSVRWVCSMKDVGNGTLKPKARLVARGYEEKDKHIDKESPTVGKDSLRVLLSTVSNKGWKLRSIDIKTAFLQGEEIRREVFVKPPVEANCTANHIWKLKKSVYGLTDASLQWYSSIKKFMLSVGGKMSKLDSALFIWHNGKDLLGVIAVHVDDLLCAGTADFEGSVLTQLRKTFLIGKED